MKVSTFPAIFNLSLTTLQPLSVQVFLLVIVCLLDYAWLKTAAKFVDVFSFGQFIYLVYTIKLFVNGSIEDHHHWRPLLFKVDAAPPNFDDLWPTFPRNDVKVLGLFGYPALPYQISTFCCCIGFSVIAIAYLVWLVLKIIWALSWIYIDIYRWVFSEKTNGVPNNRLRLNAPHVH